MGTALGIWTDCCIDLRSGADSAQSAWGGEA